MIMKVYGQLEKAQLENKTSDGAAATAGMIWLNTVTGKVMLDDATLIRALIKNDQKAIFGNSGTAADNIRVHRGAAGVMQLVSGADVTAEGTLSTALNQLSARVENYTDAAKPAFGNAGRLAYLTDLATVVVDTGAAWSALGGGGGGGSLQWLEELDSPVAASESFMRVYKYGAGLSQKLYALIRVPDSYSPGRQLKLKTDIFSPDSSGTGLIQTVTTLIRKATDLITSTTNQHTSTNAAITFTGGTASIPQEVSLDLSNGSGLINSVAISKGDLLLVCLQRGTDTATDDIRALVYGAEVLLQ